jgi:glycogen(starch) synthase
MLCAVRGYMGDRQPGATGVRVVLFPSAYAPALGGVEELSARLAAGLVGAGHPTEVWVNCWPASLAAQEVIDGVTVRRFDLALPAMNATSLGRFTVAGPRALAALRRTARRFSPDVIHVQCFSSNGIYATALAALTGAQLIVTLQGETMMDDHDVYEHSALLRQGLRTGLRRADAVSGCSEFVLDDAVARFGLAPGRGVVIPNGVDPVERAAPESLALPFARFVLAYGRMVEKKGFDLLLKAFAQVAGHFGDVGLLLGGEGAARTALAAQVTELGLEDRVVFPGRLSRAQVAWATDQAAVCVMPSRVEPFGIVVLEAMRAGTPVIATSRGGAGEILQDGIQGQLIDPFDTAGLASALGAVLRDPAQAAAMGTAGRERAAEFGWAEITRRYLELYSGAAER